MLGPTSPLVFVMAGLLLFSPGALVGTAPTSASLHPSVLDRPTYALPDPVSYSALGDSITPAFDANSTAVDAGTQPYYSYAVGWNTSVFSIWERLERLYGPGSVTTHLLAVPGDRSVDMIWQAQRAVQNRSGFVTVMIGGNDLCDHSGSYPSETLTPTSVANFSANLNQTFTILRNGLPASTIIALANVVNVSRLAVLFAGNSQAQTVYSQVCPALLSGTGIALLRSTQMAYNAAEQTIARHFNVSLWDMGELNFTASDVNTLDYFHPSVAGQGMIASLFWDSLPYAKMLPALSVPSLPSTVFEGGPIPLNVSYRDVVAANVSVLFEPAGATQWTVYPLAQTTGTPDQGTFAGTLPLAATATPGALHLYFKGSDGAGSTTYLPADAPTGYYTVNVTAVTPLSIVSFRAAPAAVTVGTLTNLSVVATGGVAPYAYAYAGLPFGCLSQNNSVLSCRPAAPGNLSVQVWVNDSSRRSAHATVGLTVVAPGGTLLGVAISPPNATVLPDSEVVLSAIPDCGGQPCPAPGPTFAWSLTNSTLGSLSNGTGDYTILRSGSGEGVMTVSVVASYAGTARAASITVTISTSAPGQGRPAILRFAATPEQIRLSNSTTFAVSVAGGALPYTYVFYGLPPGCGAVSRPSIACTPTLAGNYSVEVVVTDARADIVNATTTLLVVAPSGYPILAAFTSSPARVMVADAVTFAVAIYDGSGTLHYVYGGLPPGCASQDRPSFTCDPSVAGTYSILVTVTDGANHSVAGTLVLTVLGQPVSAATPWMGGVVPTAVFLGAVVVTAVLFAFVLWRRRHRVGLEGSLPHRPN